MTQLPTKFRLNEIAGVRFVDPSSLANIFGGLYQKYNDTPFFSEKDTIIKEAYQLIINLGSLSNELPTEVFVLKDLHTYASKKYILFHMQQFKTFYSSMRTAPYSVDDLLHGIADNAIPFIGITTDGDIICVFLKDKTEHRVYMTDPLVDEILINVPQIVEELLQFTVQSKYSAIRMINDYMKGLKSDQYPLPKGTRYSTLLGGLMSSDGTKNCGIRKRGLPRVGAEFMMPQKSYIVKCEESIPSEAILIEILRRKYWSDIPFVKTIAIAQSRHSNKCYQVMDIVKPITAEVDEIIAKYKMQYLHSTDLSDAASRDDAWEMRVRLFFKEVFMHIQFFIKKYNETLLQLHQRGLNYEDRKLDNIAWDDKHRFIFLDTELSFANDQFNPIDLNTVGFHHEGSVISNLVPYSLEKRTRDELFYIMKNAAIEIGMPMKDEFYGGKKKKNGTRKKKTTKK